MCCGCWLRDDAPGTAGHRAGRVARASRVRRPVAHFRGGRWRASAGVAGRDTARAGKRRLGSRTAHASINDTSRRPDGKRERRSGSRAIEYGHHRWSLRPGPRPHVPGVGEPGRHDHDDSGRPSAGPTGRRPCEAGLTDLTTDLSCQRVVGASASDAGRGGRMHLAAILRAQERRRFDALTDCVNVPLLPHSPARARTSPLAPMSATDTSCHAGARARSRNTRTGLPAGWSWSCATMVPSQQKSSPFRRPPVPLREPQRNEFAVWLDA
jgi:hypothetical protein